MSPLKMWNYKLSRLAGADFFPNGIDYVGCIYAIRLLFAASAVIICATAIDHWFWKDVTCARIQEWTTRNKELPGKTASIMIQVK